MSFLKNLFSPDKDYKDLILEFRSEIFEAYSIKDPTNAQYFNATLAIAIAFTGLLNHFGQGNLNHKIDKIVDAADLILGNLTFKIEEIALDEDEIQLILSEMPSFTNPTRKLSTNGTALFPILYNSRCLKYVQDILEHTSGPLGAPGYASIVIGNMVVGPEDSKDGFMQVSMQTMKMLQEIIKS